MRRLILAAMAGAAIAFACATAAHAQMPKEGDAAPDIELAAAGITKVLPYKKEGDKISLKEFKDKKNVVLFFFPKAMTPG